MKTLFHYEVRIYKKPCFMDDRFTNDVVEIVAENEDWIVINDRMFSKVTKSKNWEFSYSLLNKPKVNIHTSGVLQNGIYYTLYSEKKKQIKLIRTAIKNKIRIEFGFLDNVDLSIIK